MTLPRCIAEVSEVVGAFVGREGIEQRADAPPCGFDGALCGFAQQMLKLGDELFDRIEIGTVGRHGQEMRASARIAALTAGFLWLERLSTSTMSPGPSVGQSCSSIHAVKLTALIG